MGEKAKERELEEVSETTSSREWNRRRESELARMKSSWGVWPEAEIYHFGNGWSRCTGQSEGGISASMNSVIAVHDLFLDILAV